jgi:hypothetical protein
MPTHSLNGIPILAQLDRVALPGLRLTGLLVIAGAALTGGPSLALADWVTAHSAVPVSSLDVAFGVFNGAFAGLALGVARMAARHLEQSVRRNLGHDPLVAERMNGPTPVMRYRWVVALVIIAYVLQAWLRLLREVEQASGTGEATLHLLFVFLPLLVNFLAGGLLLLGFGTAVVLLRRFAQGLEPDLRRLDQYSCFALPALYLIAALSVTLGAGAAGMVLFDGAAAVVPSFLGRTSTMFGVALPFALLPMWEIHRRILVTRDAERERVVRALDGDGAALADSVVDRRGGSDRGEWMSQLLWLDSLPTWPLGGYLQRFVLFGLLPPITWVLAAFVENALF